MGIAEHSSRRKAATEIRKILEHRISQEREVCFQFRISFTFDNPHSFKLKEQYIFHFRIW